MATVRTSVEGARGCGYRKGGGLYLVSGQLSEPCPLLPIPLHVCQTCGAGIKQTRGYTWIMPEPLLGPGQHGTPLHDHSCPLGEAMTERAWRQGERAGLLWIGERYYRTAREFMDEAQRMGVSRRIPAVPRDFKVGETWVAMAHPKAISEPCPECSALEVEAGVPGHLGCQVCGGHRQVYTPGVVTFFLPTAVEYIVEGSESEAELDALEERGLQLVKVVRAEENRPLDEAGVDDDEEIPDQYEEARA